MSMLNKLKNIDKYDLTNIVDALLTSSEVKALTLDDYDASKPTFLFIDDYASIVHYFEKLIRKTEVGQSFNMVYSTESTAVFKILKTLLVVDYFKVDVIITDITFGGAMLSKNLDGIELVHILKILNPDLIFRFITGHRIDYNVNEQLFKEFRSYTNESLLEYVSFKDRPITSNIELLTKLFEGSKYERVFPNLL